MPVDEMETARTARPGADIPAAATTGVLVVPGARLAYEVTGQGPAVVLVHGFGLDMRMWDQQVGHLAARFRVVRYDCRGFGASGPLDPAVPYTHAGDLIALLDHLAIVIVGDRATVEAPLKATNVAPITLLDIEGNAGGVKQ